VVNQLSEDRFDFISDPDWAFFQDDGILYLSDQSKIKLELPMRLVAYEDLMSGTVVLTGTSINSEKIQTLAITNAPDFAEFDGKTSLDNYLMDELWPRRIIWTALLQEEASFLEMVEQTLAATSMQEESFVAPLSMMTMSVQQSINDFRLIQNATNHLDLSVNLPVEFVGATIYLQSSTNLVEGVWSTVFQSNAVSTGMMHFAEANIPNIIYTTSVSTNWVDCENHTMPGETCTNQTLVVMTNRTAIGGGLIYYRSQASSTNDYDSDGLDNVSEYEAGTDYQDSDSDDDALTDGEEVSTYGLNPLSSDSNGDGVPDAIDANMMGTTGEDGVLIILPSGQYRHLPESALSLNSYGAYGAE
jgi:hypothetical protein